MGKTIVFIVAILANALGTNAEVVKLLSLAGNHPPISSEGFFIENVRDARLDTGCLARTGHSGGVTVWKFGNGLAGAIQNYVRTITTQTPNAAPITLELMSVKVTVQGKNGGYHAHIALVEGFYAGTQKLMEFSREGDIQEAPDLAPFFESFLAESTADNLEKFSGQWDMLRSHVAMRGDVVIQVEMGSATGKPSQVGYTTGMTLDFDDFQGPPDAASPMLATTASGVGFGYKTRVENGHINVDITVTPYFAKDKSWFKPTGKTAALLAHERLHFAIRVLQAQQLVDTLRALKTDKNHYTLAIEQVRQDNEREGQTIQERYDDETRHGTDAARQAKWAEKVSEGWGTLAQ